MGNLKKENVNMYFYLYLIDFIASLNSVINFFVFTYFILGFFVIAFKLMFESFFLSSYYKQIFNKKTFIIWLVFIVISCLLPSKLSMYSYLLETNYEKTNNTVLYQDFLKLVKQKLEQ